MRVSSLRTVLLATLHLSQAAFAAEPVAIRLDQIWGYDLPGTKDVRELEPKADPTMSVDELQSHLDVWKILRVLNRRPQEGETAGPAFIVEGSGKKALEGAEEAFSSSDYAAVLPADKDLTIVFYSHLCGRYVRLISVERLPRRIIVKYQFVAHQYGQMTTRFALIPIGAFSDGPLEVQIEQLDPINERGQPVRPVSHPEQFVCNSASYAVR